MSLAVYDNRPWICTVYYYLDNDFNFYIFTSPKTKHGLAMSKNNKVACNIFDSHQKVTDKKVGAQVQGTAVVLNSIDKLKWALKMWNATNPGISSIINFKNMKKKIISGKIYKITPEKIQFFNEELYKDKEFEIFNFNN
jgi:uncharacterized protein YhbP (UPF0306 family)